ncbi:MAG: phosphoribosylamine--glycine ligase [Candidatus Levyibacteriota bacterium]
MREQLKIMVVGNGGRENAIGSRIKNFNPEGRQLFYATNNGRAIMEGERISLDPLDTDGIRREAFNRKVSLVIPPGEKTLAAGVVDGLRRDGVLAIGPTADQARLEASKIYFQNLVEHLNIPAPRGFIPRTVEEALVFAQNPLWEYVIKADGLAEGKGVFLPESSGEAQKIIRDLMQEGKLGDAGRKIVLQQRLYGVEESLTALVSGSNVVVFPKTYDNKRLLEGDKGPNTGGMGAIVTNEFPSLKTVKTFIQPIADFFATNGNPFHGFIYPQLIHTPNGTFVLEYNLRPGDPEFQAQLQKLDSDLYPVLKKTADGTLSKNDVGFGPGAVVNIVLAARGYPQNPQGGDKIFGLERRYGLPTSIVHAGTVQSDDGYKTDGGRVLNVISRGNHVVDAGERAYKAIGENAIHFQDMQYRRDLVAKFRKGHK